MIRVIRTSSLLQYGAALLASMIVLLFAVPGLRENLLSTVGNGMTFMRHEECYHNVGPLVYTHFFSDLLIGLSYVSISATLAYLVQRARRDIPFHWVFIAFGLFIVACGSTHFMEAWTTFRAPVYWLAGYLKLITAVASVATAVVLPPLVPRTLALVRDAKLSEQRRLELEAANRELEGLYTRVKELDELKTQFFANVSHELRTPLALILGPAQRLLSSEDLQGNHRQSVETIERNARTLLKHVNDLLDISKLEAGKMIVAYSETDLAELLRLTSAYFQSFALERGIDFKVDAPDALRAEADAEKLQRVIINLLSNAFKFTPDGGEVRCTLREIENRAALEVSDSGPGVPPDLREAIFERFRQGEGGAARRFRGTGLGLAISKEFVELHGGAITVSDAPEGGARFRVEVPTKAPAGARPSALFDTADDLRESARQALGSVETGQRRIAARDDGRGAARDSAPEDASRVSRLALAPLVLVVEDNPEMNRFVSEVVGQRCRVESAFDGREGVERALALRPDLIVCDVMMPGAGGEEFIRELRAHEELRDVPVLILSAKADDDLRVRLLREGAQDFLTKPFVAEELCARAENLVGIKVTRELLQREVESRSGDLTQLAGEVSARRHEMEAALAALREANRKLEAIIEASPLAIITLDEEMRVESWSAAAERIFGWREVEVLGETLPTVPEDQREEVLRNHKAAVAGRIFSDFEARRRRRDGTLVDVAISTAPLSDAEGDSRGVVALVADITGRKRAQRALREQSEVIGQAYDAIFLRDPSNAITLWNRGAERVYGYTQEEAMGRNPHELLKTEFPVPLPQIYAKLRREGYWEGELTHTRKDGERIVVESRWASVRDDAGLVTSILEINRDITERKAAEAALRENERRLRIVTDNAPVLIAYFDAEVRFLFVNRPYAERFGMTREEIVGRHYSEIAGGSAYGAFRPYIESALAGRRVEFEIDVPYENIGRRFVHGLYAPSFGAAGDAQGFVAVLTDVTERRREEEHQKFLSDATTVLASSLDYAATLDAVARMASRYLTDYCLVDLLEDDGAITRLVAAHRDPAREGQWREMQRRFPLDPAADYTIPHVLNTGEPVLYSEARGEMYEKALTDREQIETLKRFGIRSSMIVPLRARGRTLGAISFVSTDAARRYTERELGVAEELARRAALAVDNARLYERAQEANRAKDEFLATLSHELRTPLTPIVGWVHLLGAEGLNPADFRHGLAVIDKNSQALSRLINDLLDMSAILNGKMRIDRSPVVVPSVVAEAVETVRAQADKRGIEIELTGCDTTDGQSLVAGDRTRLAQVFWNLLTNAVKFSDDGGRVRVSCGRDSGSYVVSVEDEGIGITPEFLPHVFDRFRQADMSTTKLYGGLGIGLALVRSFVEAHGGTARAESAGPGRGSRFTVKLPLAASGAGGQELGVGEETAEGRPKQPTPAPTKSDESEPTPNPHPLSSAPRRALLVEDAPDTLEMLRRFFAARGFEVTACSEPAEALDVATHSHFDIIVTDIGLPNIDGYELLRRLRHDSPHLAHVPALAVTGFAAEADAEAARAAGFDAHIAKPFDPASLAEAVDELLARRHDPADFGNGGE